MVAVSVAMRATTDAHSLAPCSLVGFCFIMAVRNATKHTILRAFESRMHNAVGVELEECLANVHKIAWMRMIERVEYARTGSLTCHVLDTALGCPAAGMRITLHRIHANPDGESTREALCDVVTNDDGRTGAVLAGEAFKAGVYEWTFYVADYFAGKPGAWVAGQPFLTVVPLRFGVDNAEAHYHVPLLCSPWSYSTYRGS